jgi:hypothetical protein
VANPKGVSIILFSPPRHQDTKKNSLRIDSPEGLDENEIALLQNLKSKI